MMTSRDDSSAPTAASSRSPTATFRQVGYFRDSRPNRIFTFAFHPGTAIEDVKRHAERLQYTTGSMTAAYYYLEGSTIPADGVTLAGSMPRDNEVIYETPGLSPWRYAYMRYFNGASEFVDCENQPSNDFCRK